MSTRAARGKPYDVSRNVSTRINGVLPSYKLQKKSHMTSLKNQARDAFGNFDPVLLKAKIREADNDNMQQQRCDDKRRADAMVAFAQQHAPAIFDQCQDKRIIPEGDHFGRVCMGALWVMEFQVAEIAAKTAQIAALEGEKSVLSRHIDQLKSTIDQLGHHSESDEGDDYVEGDGDVKEEHDEEQVEGQGDDEADEGDTEMA